MSRIAALLGLIVAVAFANACAAPTAPTSRGPSLKAHGDSGVYCGWPNPNGC